MDAISTVAALRHDLRTPLNQIIGYSEMLAEDAAEADAAGAASVISHLRDAAFRLLELLPQLLPASAATLDDGLAQRVRDGVREPALAILHSAEQLRLRGESFLAPFAEHIQTAARDLADFAERGALPRRETQTPVTTTPSTAASKANLLVVDDNERNREVLSRQLERQGYSVFTASNGREALQFLHAGPFDLVLLDVLMPQVDGFAALEQIKADGNLRDIPVVMISASDEYASVIRCIESGAEDYLPKPFDPVLLRARIKASLEKKFLRDEQRRRSEELERAYRDLQKVQDQLITQEKLASLGSLAAGIAHEIRNPLNFVNNFAGLTHELVRELREGLARGEADVHDTLRDLESNIAKIEEHGKRADRIVRGMLMHSRKQGGLRELVDINALVSESAHLAYHGLRTQDMSFNSAIELKLDATLAPLPAFPQDLSRVFINIATNAFHAVFEKKQRSRGSYQPSVLFTTKAWADAGAEIRIRDNGAGIPADLRKKIFEPFFTTRPPGSGTGLGLSISHEVVVKEHGGELLIETEPGEFAEFIVRLPRNAG